LAPEKIAASHCQHVLSDGDFFQAAIFRCGTPEKLTPFHPLGDGPQAALGHHLTKPFQREPDWGAASGTRPSWKR
jgi:hypothetical protein